MNTIKILIANKYFLMNYAIRCIFQEIKGYNVIGIAEEEILVKINEFCPDLLVIELDILKTNKFELLGSIRKKYPSLKILALMEKEDRELLKGLSEYKLEGFLLKNTSREELLNAARTIVKGEVYYSNSVSNLVLENIKNETEENKNLQILSEREKEILNLIAQGNDNQVIGKKLFISANTVLTHRRNIMKKLKVKSTPQLLIKGAKQGIISFLD